MSWFKKSTNSSDFYCFVCSGNNSLIGTFYETFKSADLKLQMELYSIDVQTIKDKNDLPVNSTKWLKYIGDQESNINKLDDLIKEMAFSASKELRIFYISLKDDMYLRMQMLYKQMLSEALNQRILPFPMFVTQDKAAKELLINFFN